MAIGVTASFATKYGYRVLLTGDGATTSQDLALATITTALPAGPLKTFLSSLTSTNQATARAALLDNEKLRVGFIPREASTTFGVDADNNGGVPKFVIKTAADTKNAYLELEYRHSAAR